MENQDYLKKSKHYGLSFYKVMITENTDEAYLVAQELVENLFFLLSKQCTKFCNKDFYMPPYMFSERRLDSVVLPALAKICDSIVMTELPVNRKIGNDNYQGRADYWCIYKGYSFVIELKHSKDHYETPNTRKHAIVERWRKMLKQLNSVKKEILEFEENTKGVIRLGLHMVSSFSPKYLEDAPKFDAKKIEEIAKRLQKDLTGKSTKNHPDMLLCWKIPSAIVKSGDEKGFWLYPGLWTIAKIYPPLIHEGATNNANH